MTETAPTPEPEPYQAKFKVRYGHAHPDSMLSVGYAGQGGLHESFRVSSHPARPGVRGITTLHS